MFTLDNVSSDDSEQVVNTWLKRFYTIELNKAPILSDIGLLKDRSLMMVYIKTESKRGEFITNLPGKMGEYALKKASYDEWVRGGSPRTPNPAKHIIAEAERFSYSPTMAMADLLTLWGERDATWTKTSALIASIERDAIVKLKLSSGVADVSAVLIKLLKDLYQI